MIVNGKIQDVFAQVLRLFFIFSFSIVLFSSCSTFRRTLGISSDSSSLNSSSEIADDNPSESDSNESTSKISGPVKSILGSAEIGEDGVHHRESYYLAGAEHLNLDNYYFDIPVVYNDSVKMWIDYFLNRGRNFFERYVERAGRYAPVLGKILEDHGMPRDLIFLAMAESGFQNNAKSWAHAVGPWQFMSFTAKKYGLNIDWYVDERRDPIKATIAASKYLTKLYDDFGAWELAAAGYNAGEGKVSRAIQKYKTEDFWKLRHGRYLKSETKNYVPKIMALAIIGKNLRAFGFEDIDFHEPLNFEEVAVPPLTDLMTLSDMLGVPFEEIQRLNPEILRWYTPPNIGAYTLRIPVGLTDTYNGLDLTLAKATSFQTIEVGKKGLSVNELAKKYKVANYVFNDLNSTHEGSTFAKGETVMLPFRIGQSPKDDMYNDLYEVPRRYLVKNRVYKSLLASAKSQGRKITNPKEYYVVQKGDTLWVVAQKRGVSIHTLIASNMDLLRKRMIRAGDRLIVK